MEYVKKYKNKNDAKEKSNENKINDSKAFNIINILLLTLFTIIIIVPIWNVVISSFASSHALAKGDFILWPSELSLDNYRRVFNDSTIWRSFFISIAKTIIGVLVHTAFCAIFAYAMSKSNLIGRSLYSTMGIATLVFSGGMIPMYLLIRSLGLLNSFWVYIIPALFSYYDVIILMNFFREIPISLEESARIDGAGDWIIFKDIYLPLIKPALATIALFHGVAQWNDFMTTKLYVTNKSLYPLQMRLYEIITEAQAASSLSSAIEISTTSKGVQLATIVVTATPIIMVYPFIQKHFITGMMMGAVKE